MFQEFYLYLLNRCFASINVEKAIYQYLFSWVGKMEFQIEIILLYNDRPCVVDIFRVNP
jgi:hypothetical protein